jgi:protein-tyrosine phosphatase
MDVSNARYLRRMFGDKADKCQPLLSRDVADPWYSGDFAQTWEDILTGCTRILEALT